MDLHLGLQVPMNLQVVAFNFRCEGQKPVVELTFRLRLIARRVSVSGLRLIRRVHPKEGRNGWTCSAGSLHDPYQRLGHFRAFLRVVLAPPAV